MELSPLIHEIAGHLEQEQNSLRIKKLIFCACKHKWENDLNILNGFSFQDLVLELYQTQPTINQLSAVLYSIASTLSRPGVYSVVANTVIGHLDELYSYQIEQEDATLILEPTDIDNSTDSILDQVIFALEQDEEALRIKKLLFCARTNKWENKTQILNRFSLKDLIQDLRQFYPTIEQFSQVIYSIVKDLSRPAVYALVAKKIVTQTNQLYSRDEASTQLRAATPAGGEQSTHLVAKSTPQKRQPQPDATELVDTSTAIEDNNKLMVEDDFATTESIFTNSTEITLPDADYVSTELRRQPKDNSEPTAQFLHQPAQTKKPQVSSTIINRHNDIFELRIALMKYTNPLRAKILLFSVLYHPFQGGQDWLAIKNYEIDNLITTLLSTYPYLSELEKQLSLAADTLDEPEEYSQAAGAILHSLQPLYS